MVVPMYEDDDKFPDTNDFMVVFSLAMVAPIWMMTDAVDEVVRQFALFYGDSDGK